MSQRGVKCEVLIYCLLYVAIYDCVPSEGVRWKMRILLVPYWVSSFLPFDSIVASPRTVSQDISIKHTVHILGQYELKRNDPFPCWKKTSCDQLQNSVQENVAFVSAFKDFRDIFLFS